MEIENKILKAAKVLSYSRSIEPSDGVFRAYNSNNKDDIRNVIVEQVTVLGQHSNYVANVNSIDKTIGGNNIQTVEKALIPLGCDRLQVAFTLAVVGNSVQANGTDNATAANLMSEIAEKYADLGGYKTLASLYVTNIANASFVYRNRMFADDATVTITVKERSITFNPLALDAVLAANTTKDEATAKLETAVVDADDLSVQELVEMFADALANNSNTLHMQIVYDADTQELREVYPSQEFTRNEVKNSKEDISRVLSGHYVNKQKVATFHSQKLGAAIRNIDVWNGIKTVPINPYGGDKLTQTALRGTTQVDAISFYDMMMKPKTYFKDFAEAQSLEDIDGNVHFFIATLIRGGVLQAVNKK